MPVQSFWIVTDGLPTERRGCSSLTSTSTQDTFEFFHTCWLQEASYIPLAPSGSFKAQRLGPWLIPLSICPPTGAEVWILPGFTCPQLPLFPLRLYCESVNSCHHFCLTSCFYSQLSIFSFPNYLLLRCLPDNGTAFLKLPKSDAEVRPYIF